MFNLIKRSFLFKQYLFFSKLKKNSFFYYKIKNRNSIQVFLLLNKLKKQNFTQWQEIEYLASNNEVIEFYEFNKIKTPKTRLVFSINSRNLKTAKEKLKEILKK